MIIQGLCSNNTLSEAIQFVMAVQVDNGREVGVSHLVWAPSHLLLCHYQVVPDPLEGGL